MKKINPGSFKRILITRTDRIGDLVLTTPVFQALREKFHDVFLGCLTFLENREIVEGNPYLNEVILYNKQGSEKGWCGNFFFAQSLRRKHFDVVIHLHPTSRMHLVSWLAGIPVRIGYNKKSSWTLTHSVEDLKGEGLKHEAEYNFDLLALLGVEAPKKIQTHFPLKEKDQISINFLLKNFGIQNGIRYAVLNPSASCPSKIWHAQRFGKLADLLQEKFGLKIILIGSQGDRPFSNQVKKFAGHPMIDLTGKLPLGSVGWLLKQAQILISNDSGPVHIAGAVGTPVVSIFGRSLPGLSPKRWGPLGEETKMIHKEVGCPVCLAHLCRINFLCLDVVSVEDVLEAAASLLGNRQKAPSLNP